MGSTEVTIVLCLVGGLIVLAIAVGFVQARLRASRQESLLALLAIAAVRNAAVEATRVRITGANPNSLRGEAVLDGSPAGSYV